MDKPNNIKIYSKVDTEPIITGILQNNHIEESDSDIMEKLSQGKPVQGQIIISAVEKILLEKLPDENICAFLKTELNVLDEVAKTVYLEIKSKLVPVIKTRTVENAPIKETSTVKIPRPIKKTSSTTKIETPKPPIQQSGPDKYREPVE